MDTETPEAESKSTYTVRFTDGEEVEVSDGQTILNACIEDGVNHEYSCRVGMCLACVGKIVEGDVKQPGARGLSDEEREDYVLTCMARPASDMVIDRGEYPPSIEDGDE
ncbi:2Fe-2S iron-sulfur cluster-binding protein [Halorutilales archaeon Cl-col2-1]